MTADIAQTEAVAATPKNGPTILIVDDEPDILLSLKPVLEHFLPGAAIVPAQSGREALEILNGRKVDLVIADFKMPGMNGLELLTAIRDSTNIPRILITAFPATGLAVRAINEARVHSFFIKPFDGMRLVEAIRDALAEGPDNRAEARRA